MNTNRNKRKTTYRDVPPATPSAHFNGRGSSRRFEEPPSPDNRRLEGRRAPRGDDRFRNRSRDGDVAGRLIYQDDVQYRQISPYDYEVIEDGYGNQTIISMPPPHQYPDYDYDEPYDDEAIYTADEVDQPIINIYHATGQPPQMGLILSTVAITMAVLGLAFFWLIGGEGISRMASSVGQNSEGTITSLVNPSTGGDGPAAIIPSSGQLAPFFAPSVLYWEAQIIEWAAQHNLDPNMVATVMQIESCGDPQALSNAGATGLFQVMPFHFTAGENMYDPQTNALRGMNYLAERLIQTEGDVGRAFAGYNGGHVAAGSSWDSWANETQRYFTWSTGIYDEALRGLAISETLNQWYEAGGRSLCAQAEERLNLR